MTRVRIPARASIELKIPWGWQIILKHKGKVLKGKSWFSFSSKGDPRI